jgi:uncharacterized protein (TIGR03435 family)
MPTVPKAVPAIVTALATSFVVFAQAPAQPPSAGGDPAFEVASVKPNKSSDGRVMLGFQPGGRVNATNVPLRLLIRYAYQIQDFQLAGTPDWIGSERFDVVAKAEGDVPPPQPFGPPSPLLLMMRTLLAERFKLAVHREMRELPIYALIVARTDGKLGPQLKASTTDCAAVLAAARGPGGPSAPPAPGQRPQCGISLAPGRLGGGGFPLSQLAATLSTFVQRVVVDRTGLTGNFDFELTWTPDQLPQGPPPPGAPPLPAIDPNGPSIYTAVQEQLGLKLDSQRGPVDVLVVDHVERPTED